MSPAFRAVLLTLALPAAARFAAAEIPRPEHPRPDFQREAWLNLNGAWEFAETDDEAADFLNQPMPDKIVVPFCRESELSGLGRKGFVKYVWYRRTIEIPGDWQGKRVLFHVGACDWETTAWVNGVVVGSHRGGSTPFTFDITSALRPGGNTVTLKVYDDHRTGCQASGKQSDRPESHGCMYTRVTGIWQTVWLEAVPQSYIGDCFFWNEPTDGVAVSLVRVEGPRVGLVLEAEAFAEGKSMGKVRAPVEWGLTTLGGSLADTHLWSIEDPFLYDLEIRLMREGKVVDKVKSYFGLRKIEIQGGAILLNGKPVFQRLVLDQGFYPKGIWTAPTDSDLERDIRLSMEAGFNGARLHQKVFEPRFLYHADRLGYLVWGEYPNWGLNYSDLRIDEPVIREWTDILARDRNHPSIIGWCPFNETPVEAARIQNMILELTRRVDPSRPLLDTSGWTHSHPFVDLLDAHDYDQNPETYRTRWESFFEAPWRLPDRYGVKASGSGGIPFFVSEFGGIGWDIKGTGWGYGNAPKSLEEFYDRFEGLVDANLDNRNFFGYCYTQLTDIEQEQNGIYSYDRVAKFDNARLKQIQSRRAAYEEHPPLSQGKMPETEWSVLLPTAHDKAPDGDWLYTFENPGEDFIQTEFDAASWKSGKPGFGSIGADLRGAEWNTGEIWLRKTVEYDGEGFDVAVLITWFDDDTEIYLNGKLLWNHDRWNTRYEAFEVTRPILETLRKGKNTFAVHTRQDKGGQYIDAGILLGSFVDVKAKSSE